jgi:LAO/AO transport system kinase
LIIPFLIIIFESMKFSTEELIEGIQSGNKRLIAKAITLVESKKLNTGYRQKNFEKNNAFYRKFCKSRGDRSSGAGKSTFIESFGRLAIAQWQKSGSSCH